MFSQPNFMQNQDENGSDTISPCPELKSTSSDQSTSSSPCDPTYIVIPDGASEVLATTNLNCDCIDSSESIPGLSVSEEQLLNLLLDDKYFVEDINNLPPLTPTFSPTQFSAATQQSSPYHNTTTPNLGTVPSLSLPPDSQAPSSMMPPLGSDLEDSYSVIQPMVQQPPLHHPQFYSIAQFSLVSQPLQGHFVHQHTMHPTDAMMDMNACISIPMMVPQAPPSTAAPMMTEPPPPPAGKRSQKRKLARSASTESLGSPSTSMTNLSLSGSFGESEVPDSRPLNPEMKKLRRLEKNREAAQQFRQRQKTYISGLENQVENLSGVNKDLQERLSLMSGENMLLKEQLAYLRHFITKAMSFKGTGDGVSAGGVSISASSCNSTTNNLVANSGAGVTVNAQGNIVPQFISAIRPSPQKM